MNRRIGVVLSYLLMIFEVFSTLLITPFIIRTLGQAEYGVYRLSAAVNAYLLLLDLGIGNAITRYVAKYRAENNELQGQRFLGVATVYYLIIGVVAFILGIVLTCIFPTVFAKGLSPEEVVLGQKLLGITMINSSITLATAAYTNVIIAYERFLVSKGCSIIQILIRMILTVISLKLGFGSVGLVLIQLITTVLCRGFFVLYVLYVIKLRPRIKGVDLSFIKEVIGYSSLILLQMLATQLNSTVDQVMIGAMVSGSATIIAIYSVGTQVVQYFQSIGGAFTGILMPGIARLVATKPTSKQLTDEMVRIGRFVLIVTGIIWACFVVNGRSFIVLWAGEANESAFYVSMILMTAYLFITAEAIGNQILWALNQHKEQAILKILIVLCNIILTALLIKWNPLLGATIGTFISLIGGDVILMNVIFAKKLSINIRCYYQGLFSGILFCLIMAVGVGGLTNLILKDNTWIMFLIKNIVMCVVYLGMMLAIGFNDYERNFLKSIFIKKR